MYQLVVNDKILSGFVVFKTEYIHYENNRPSLITGITVSNNDYDACVSSFAENDTGYLLYWNNLENFVNMMKSTQFLDKVNIVNSLVQENSKLEDNLMSTTFANILGSLKTIKEEKGEEAARNMLTASIDKIVNKLSEAAEVSAKEENLDKSQLN